MRRLHLASYILCAALFPGCGPDATGPAEAPEQYRTCHISYVDWPGAGVLNATTDSPWGCPATLPARFIEVPFHATITWQSNWVQHGYVQFSVLNRNFHPAPGVYIPTWSAPGGSTVVVQGPGHYTGGSGIGTQNNGDPAAQQDYLSFKFTRLSDSKPAYATWVVPWQDPGFPIARVSGPTSVQPYTDFLLNADLLDITFVPPITYTWTRNGEVLAWTQDWFQQWGGDMGVNHEFNVTITDSEGRSHSLTHYVHTLNCVGEGCNEY
jgi:hypothetical protein